ncbi:tetratricopeptide repeat protein [Marichromatium bheemlicum]|uniref:Tetratricopeptide repeat protein n=1 Tax=Marichromatium bheemlicum TaxID=365339 RepID=A0ABX1I8T6_9GAMM|nr:tetratricopeptide repeat protein [Marichromatium bheemlicum]NKN33638.1 tetratricopeptide repeat protein [Marichromatium bheemlicum]
MRVFIILIAALVLGACASQPRQGDPAPVVRVTPRPEPAPVAQAAEPRTEQSVAAEPEAQVYAYRDPAQLPPPETPVAPPASAGPGAPALVSEAPTVTPLPSPAPAESRPSAPAPGIAPAPQGPRTAAVITPQQPVVQPAPAPTPAPAVTEPDLPTAAAALARQAERQRQSGDYAGAAASLERSLRIAPQQAYLWNRLARVRLEQGQTGQAGNLASRSNNLAGGDVAIRRDNWLIIADVRRRAGDVAGASEAERRASGG